MKTETAAPGWYITQEPGEPEAMLRYWTGKNWWGRPMPVPEPGAAGAAAGTVAKPLDSNAIKVADKYAVSSRVVGIIGIFFAWGFVPAGFVLAIVAISQGTAGGVGSRPDRADTGVALGIAALVCSIINALWLCFFNLFTSWVDHPPSFGFIDIFFRYFR
ncbi:MAG: hypothetical protein LBR44_02055 [Clostridiales Family XIII bacterium]|jgi:hypothetical protein|nr:hypothetical protein [Clostridiales Family XIII bacterium]